MRRYTLRLVGIVLAVSAMLMLAVSSGNHYVRADQPITAKDAIALVAAQPVFAQSLTSFPDWTAKAYDLDNSYQIWHVEFYSSDEERVGWADVSMSRKRLFSWEAPDLTGIPSETQSRAAEVALQQFVKSDSGVSDLLGKLPVSTYLDAYSDYHEDEDVWSLTFEIDGEPVTIAVKFDGESVRQFAFKNPQLYGIYFPERLDYDDWEEAESSKAVAIAFRDLTVADALRNENGWTGSAAFSDDGKWAVVFKVDDKVIITAVVDTSSEKVLSTVIP